MFGLKRKTSIPAVPVNDDQLHVTSRDGNVFTVAKPLPMSITFDELQDLSEYEEVAAVLNFAPPQIAEQKREKLRRELIGFMLDNGMPIYDNKEVHDYMAALAEKDDKAFVWKMLREPVQQNYGNAQEIYDRQLMRFMAGGRGSGLMISSNTVRTKHHGQLIHGPYGYGHPVPLDILKRAASVKKQFPTAEIYVSDYAVVNPDPFIMAKIGDCEHVVFGVWDEPGFGALGRDRK